MKLRFGISLSVILIFVALPVFAYGDPTGGALFQFLTPILAMIWGVWMIVANNVRTYVANLVRKWRGAEQDESTP